ncbi:Der GTPase-activating protein YihI [Parashewanella spongiae]|uniref:Der GTPase-activating protein YihI n=1 Tax=Parashewanella spongiae TaxID=342950 RepID=A0A3A6TG79_9GAMM|nr:Der GTPase-activating protein YihI [Parashewanella spongiae]MCL1079380.1 Der GTPase-activating protein YihI [Parashewanella spongiae]RJY07523.1 Der GTPase-activating protein YihI [Parashewanella spongiae]
MPRSKKTRKVSENGPKNAPRTKKEDRSSVSKKRNNGKKSGSRHNEQQLAAQKGGSAAAVAKDARHGSKKPVILNIATPELRQPETKVKQPKLTDEQKLLQLEDNPRLNKLLDRLEEGKVLSNEDQQWLDSQLDQIESLMNKLGLNDSVETQPKKAKNSDDELFERFESGADLLKDYQN